MFFTVVITFIVVYLALNWWRLKPRNYPPGPPCLPLIGNAPFVPGKLIHVTMAGKWLKQYGPLVGLVISNRKIVAVCGPQEVFEVLKREEFQGRPTDEIIRERSFNKSLGIIFSDGPLWSEQRRFSLRHLRDFGFGKKSMEGLILEEIKDVTKEMSEKQIFQVNGLFTISALNVIWEMTAGKRISRDDEELQVLLDKLNRVFRKGNLAGGIMFVFPFLRFIIPGIVGYTEQMDSLHDMQSYFLKTIKDHEKTIDENNPRDYIDVYLKEMKLQSNNPNSTFTEEALITMCLDLFAAGSETTTGTLEFSILYMVLYPEVQKAVQKELDAVVGQDRSPSLDDRPKLHYVEAVLSEIQRISSVAPLTPPHRATKDSYLNGYFIPEDTWLLVNLHSLFHDKDHWGDPEEFRPERFLKIEGKFVKDEWLIPFGTGKRACLAETLARNTLFLFFTSFLQEYSFSVPEEDPQPSKVPLPGITIAPQPFRVKITNRF